jgi:hypothetical protein
MARWTWSVRSVVTLLDPPGPDAFQGDDVGSSCLADLAHLVHVSRPSGLRVYRWIGATSAACFLGLVAFSKHPDDSRGAQTLAVLFGAIPLGMFILREWLALRARTIPSILRSVGRWLVVFTFASAVATEVVVFVAASAETTSTSSTLQEYDWNGSYFVQHVWLIPSSYVFLVSFAAGLGLALAWRARASWRVVLFRMSAAVVMIAFTAATVLVPLTWASNEDIGSLMTIVSFFVILGFLSLGPLIRSAGITTAATISPDANVVDAARYIAAARLQSQLAIGVLLLSLDLALSHRSATATVFKVRSMFAVQEAVRTLAAVLPKHDEAFDRFVSRDIWGDRSIWPWWSPTPWESALGDDHPDWAATRQMDRSFGSVTRAKMSDEWRTLGERELFEGEEWVRVSGMWLTAPAESLFGLRIRTAYGLKVDVGGSDDLVRPKWSRVVSRTAEDRGPRDGVWQIVRKPWQVDDGSTTHWLVTKANSPEYDFGRWYRLHAAESGKSRLYAIALGEGIEVPRRADPEDVLVKVERTLIRRSVSLPTIGLNLPPLRAIIVLSVLFLYLLIGVHNGVRYALRDPKRAEGEPWLILDAETRLEKSAAVAWTATMIVGPWLLGVGFLHMAWRQAMLYGNASGMWAGCLIALTVGFVAISSRVALALLSSLRILREFRRSDSIAVSRIILA